MKLLKTNQSKFVALLLLSTALSSTTVVLGGLPLLPARRVGGRLAFWSSQLAIALAFVAAGLPFYGLVILAQTLLIGTYVEVEEHGGSVFTSGLTAILASVGTFALVGGAWLKIAGLPVAETLRKRIDPLVEQLSAASVGGAKSALTTNAVLQQIPSGVVIALLLSLALALVAERRLSAAWHLATGHGNKDGLRAFRAPDAIVWVVVAAIAGAFLRHGKAPIELISVNLLNVLVVLYFFQGLAVVSAAFRTFKVGGIWQAIWYVLLVLQLFLMVSLVGFADYWLDFRERLTRKPAESNRGF